MYHPPSPDWDELEDHERILLNDLFVAQTPSITDPRPPSPRARPSSASVASPSTPALPVSPAAASPPVSSIMSREEFNESQIADQPRLPWNWSNLDKNREAYAPTVVGKLWYRTLFELEQLTENRRRNFGHIFRIMETELGEQRLGDARCRVAKPTTKSVGSTRRRAQRKCLARAMPALVAESLLKWVGAACRNDASHIEIDHGQPGQSGQNRQCGGCFHCLIRLVHHARIRREMESDSLRAGIYAAYPKVFVSAISLSSAAVRVIGWHDFLLMV